MAKPLPDPPIMVITDRTQTRLRLEDVAEAVFEGGCRWLSLREPDLDHDELVRLLYRLVTLGERYRAQVSVHHDYGAALATGAEGVHLARDGSVKEAREYLGKNALIGISVHDKDELQSAIAMSADYVTLSPIFPTASKPGYGPDLGPYKLATLARGASIPVLALGGVAPENVGSCVAAGAVGVAVMGGVMRARDPRAMMRGLVTSLRDALARAAAARHSRGDPHPPSEPKAEASP
jgi:thiamine-phosphate pyrophosphorylase